MQFFCQFPKPLTDDPPLLNALIRIIISCIHGSFQLTLMGELSRVGCIALA